MLKIVEETSNHAELISQVYSNLSIFEGELASLLVHIFEECMKFEATPNPLAENLHGGGNKFIDDILDKISSSSKGDLYAQLMKIWTFQPETHLWQLRSEVINKLAENISNSDPKIALNWIEILENMLTSESHQDIISKFAGENYEAVMRVIKSFNSNEVLLLLSLTIITK